MDKKGFLLAEETLKIILAVIAIGFLIYFLSALYFSKVNGEKSKFAEDEIARIESAIDSSSGGEVFELDLINPEGWFLIGFSEGVKPNSCFGENCICICDDVSFDNLLIWKNRQANECDEKGSCIVQENLGNSFFIPINGPDEINFVLIKQEGNSVLVREK